MAEEFTLVVTYKNQERSFKGELRLLGYSYKIVMYIDAAEVIFETDEERNYRAVIYGDNTNQNLPDRGLIEAVAGELEAVFK